MTTPPMLADIAHAYRQSKKPRDILWNRFVARPLAAVLLVPLSRSRATPNQITFASLVVFAASAAVLVTVPGHGGLLAAVAVLQLSYVLDCADGQLARMRGTSTPAGAHLDFLMDELKAFVLVAACGARLWQQESDTLFLLEALVGLCAVASAISLTTFIRRPEYRAATGAPQPRTAGDYGEGFEAVASEPPRSSLRRVVHLVEEVGRFLIHYPSYIVFVALANRLDLFLHVYLATNAAYAARALLGVVRSMGRSAP